jgi:rhodanese-related sulfurtransferase
MEIIRITPEEARHLLESEEGFIYLDVRTVPEFEAGHVPGAKNIPVMEADSTGQMQLNSRFVEIVQANFDQDVKCITGCQMGGRSMKAAQLLSDAGFSSVVDMRGGFRGEVDPRGQISFPGWSSLGFPVSRESSPEDRYEHLAKK